MKILLLGEFSNLHTNLKEGLVEMGHEVILVSTGDGFKGLKGDINISSRLKVKLFRKSHLFLQILSLLFKIRGFDIVQYISPQILPLGFNLNLLYLKYLKRVNEKVIYNCCGGDSYTIPVMMGQLNYSPYLNELKEGKYDGTFKLISFRKFIKNKKINETFHGIISTSYSYMIPFKNFNNFIGLVQLPLKIPTVNKEMIQLKLKGSKIKIFHGITRPEIKGSTYIVEAMRKIESEFTDLVETSIVENIPYEEYKQIFFDCDIFIDQACSYGYGMNALIALAQGKVVLSGCEKEEQETLEVKCPIINIKPNIQDIYNKILFLIKNPNKIEEISLESINYVEKTHNHSLIASKYIDLWNKV